MVVDGATGLAEQLTWRPAMMTNDKWDAKNTESVWHPPFTT